MIVSDSDAGKQRPRPRPRLLYSVIFSWTSISSGRFVAPFFEHEAGLTETMIGVTFAMQVGTTSVLGAFGGSFADVMERKYPSRGRSYVIVVGVMLGSFFFLLHSAWRWFPAMVVFQSTAWHMTLRILYAASISMVYPALEGLTLAHLEREEGMDTSDYGKERLYGSISWGITSLLVGPFLDMIGFPAMYISIALTAVITLVVVQVYIQGHNITAPPPMDGSADTYRVQDNDNAQNCRFSLWALLRIVFGTVAAAAFLFSYFCLSSGFAVVENLLFLYFEALGGSNSLNGFTTALTVVFEIPIFQVAPTLLRKYGPSALLHAASVCYVIRVLGYTLIPQGHVYWILLLEPLHGVIYACSQTGTVEFVSNLMPIGYEASGQGMAYLCRGLGGVTGLSLGGVLEEQLGPRVMYRTFAAIVGGGAILSGVIMRVCGSQLERNTEVEELEMLTTQSQPTDAVSKDSCDVERSITK